MSGFWQAVRWDWRMLHRGGIGHCRGAADVGAGDTRGLERAARGRRLARADRSRAHTGRRGRNKLLAKIAEGDTWSAAPYSARGLIALPPAPLADLAVGRSDLDPRTAEATTFAQTHSLFRNYQIASPLALALGRFDLAFVVQVLLPLLIVALGYGLMAEERERGLDRVLAVQGVSPRRLLAARVLGRATLVLAPLLLVIAALFAVGDAALGSPAQRSARFGLALLLIIGYAAFWWALVAWIGSWRLREGQTLLALLAAWVLLVLALPAVAGLSARAAHPPPSRFALIAEARAQEIAGTQRSEALLGEYAHDHPTWTPRRPPACRRGRNRYSWCRARSTRAWHRCWRASTPRSPRNSARSNAGQYASPALIVQRGMMTAAGTDERRNAAFRTQAHDYFRGYREHTGAMMLAGKTLDAENLAAMPRFVFVEPPLRSVLQALATPLLALWGLALLLAVLAWRQAPRSQSN